MIVEEAAEILEGQLVAVIPPSVQHLIMIGDHKQLKPVVYFQRLKKHHHLDLSMFERLVNCKLPYRQLGFQCRMRDEFVDLLRELKIYSELKTHYTVTITTTTIITRTTIATTIITITTKTSASCHLHPKTLMFTLRALVE